MPISIIIPCYKNEDTLIKTLKSVDLSILKTFEVIIVNDNPKKELEVLKDTCPFPLKIINNNKREGSAISRNKAAKIARYRILFFTDADVILLPETIRELTDSLSKEAPAAIGCYTKKTPENDTFSRFKNLFHSYNHDNLKKYSPSFWTGCGAIYKKTFWDLGGFDTSKKFNPIEDIDLGYRLNQKGLKIKINKHAFAVHLKKYSFWKLIYSDLYQRAIPWTRIILKNKMMPNSSNTKTSYKLSLMLTVAFLSFNILNIYAFSLIATSAMLLSLMGIILLNFKFLKLAKNVYGTFFAVKSVLLLLLYFLCCTVGIMIGTISK